MSQVRIVIQCRLSSTRLPGKAMLSLGGHPVGILCALRAGNRGHEVVVATSSEPSDDCLYDTFTAHGFRCVRGPLNDVLARFYVATEELPDDAIVVRLTADNVFPDGAFIEELIQHFRAESAQYLGTHFPASRLPYGMSAEVFTVALLRDAHLNAYGELEREHVTPWIKKNADARFYICETEQNQVAEGMRCTLDTFEDYLRLQQVFKGIDAPVSTSWQTLVQHLAETPVERGNQVARVSRAGIIQSELIFGTAQLGSSYGIANRQGKPTLEETNSLLSAALSHGVTTFDCARAYGEAEERLGRFFGSSQREELRVITKLDPLEHLDAAASSEAIKNAVDASIFRSCKELRMQQLPMLLLHRWSHRFAFDGKIWERLLELKRQGTIRNLGASVYNPIEAGEAIAEPDVECIQIPFNLLDWRWRASGFQEALSRRADIFIYARSLLLQGLLTLEPQEWPGHPNIDPYAIYEKLNWLTKALERENVADLCVAYARSQQWIHAHTIGMESLTQLELNVQLFNRNKLTSRDCLLVEETLGEVDERFLSPSNWGKVHA